MELKKLRCEMCGGNNLIKQNDFFECQNCGIKYSIEEIKKIIVERNIDTSDSVEKVNNSESINNYLNIAKHAYKANNMSESKFYCNKILEIDSKNYEAWLLKGKSAARKFRIEETINYFFNALDYAPKNKLDEIKLEITDEILDIFFAVIEVDFNNFEKKYKGNVTATARDIINNVKFMTKISKELLLKCGTENKVRSRLSTTINNLAIEEWKNRIWHNYSNIKEPSRYDALTLVWGGDAIISLIETSISLSDKDDSGVTISYSNLINLQETIIVTIYKSICGIEYYLDDQEKQLRRNKIMEWHRKWNELDSTHIIPTKE